MPVLEKKPKKASYDENSIKSLVFPDSIRAKPTLYIGPVDSRGIATILREITDNSVDEAIAGRNKMIFIKIHADGSFTVADLSETGIPVKDIEVKDAVSRKTHRVSALQAVFSITHTGGKFNDKAYAASRGTHGLGSKATNALSEEFQVWTCNKGKWFTIRFAKGVKTQDVTATKPPKVSNKVWPQGTVIKFKPDAGCFTAKAKLNAKELLAWCQVTAYLTAGLKIVVESPEGKSKVFFEKEGPKGFLKSELEAKKVTSIGAFFMHHSPLADCAIAFTDYDGQGLRGYTNGLENVEGGVHTAAIVWALVRALKPFQKKSQQFTGYELKEGIIGLVNAKLSSPQFDSQTKEKLVDERAAQPLAQLLLKSFTEFFAANKAMAARICERASALKELKAKFTVSKKALKELRSIQRSGFPAKFSAAARAPANKRELYLVEGESAGGSARQARDKNYQEVLPLKGKIVNAVKGLHLKVLESQEILYLMACLGFVPDKPHPYDHLRVGKVMILADPDPDGHHINSLVLAFFFKFMPELLAQGRVYVVDSPEYIATHPKTGSLIRARSKEALLEKVPKETAIKHIKGWGETDVDELQELAFNPDTRRLIQIEAPNKQDSRDFNLLMGENAEYRKKLLGV